MGNNKIIGEKIKALRELKQLSIEDLSERSGLSIEQIKSIEGNLDFPSLSPLIKIARVLGVRLGTFLDDQSELGPVVHRNKELSDEEKTIRFTNNAADECQHMAYHALAQEKSGRHMEPFFITIEPKSQDDDFVLSSHEGEEFIYVIEGIVEINYGKSNYVLEQGDSIYYDSIVAHHVHSAGDENAKILGVIYTPY